MNVILTEIRNVHVWRTWRFMSYGTLIPLWYTGWFFR